MAHEWEFKNPAPNTKYFKYFGCVDLRKCKKCGVIQEKQANHLWSRVTGYYWTPKVGRCPMDVKKKKSDRCADCRDGEHDNYDDSIYMTVIRDPDTNKIYRRAYICESHREMYASDGYEVYC